ncbi:aldehyde dehydrogenase family protein [Clostridium subterminale]|uniref:aldehyde dehydrogenase family protein n=1 Tax=Clostridium subterminale TaxID=1550 RepID=UPI0031E2F69C
MYNYKINKPTNEPIKSYVTGTSERLELKTALDKLYNTQTDISLIIDGKEVFTNITEEFIIPHEKGHVLARYHKATEMEKTLDLCDTTSVYGLTGAIFSNNRYNIEHMLYKLRNSAGNFYINDKPTRAVVGQQPFGGARASGTNDKAGSHLNLLRWVSPRTIKETLCQPTNFESPYMSDTQPEKSKPEDESYFGLDFISI